MWDRKPRIEKGARAGLLSGRTHRGGILSAVLPVPELRGEGALTLKRSRIAVPWLHKSPGYSIKLGAPEVKTRTDGWGSAIC